MPDDLISRSDLLDALHQALAGAWDRRAVPRSGVDVIFKIIDIAMNLPGKSFEEEEYAQAD